MPRFARLLFAFVAADVFFLSLVASAQSPAPGASDAAGEGAATVTLNPTRPAPSSSRLPPPPPPYSRPSTSPPAALFPSPLVPARIKDHSKVVGSFGVGWFGLSNVPIGTGNGAERGNIDTPVVGARYWYNEKIGIDAGLGFSIRSASSQVESRANSVQNDGPSHVSFLLHGGVPIAFASGYHYIFEVIPEFNLGFASGNRGTPDTGLKGFLIELGARVGTEIQFGFIGLPELALEGSVGLSLRHTSWSAEQNDTKNSASELQLATTSFNQPWDFFKGVVAARYYF